MMWLRENHPELLQADIFAITKTREVELVGNVHSGHEMGNFAIDHLTWLSRTD